MPKPKKSSKSTLKPTIEVQDLKPESDPKGGLLHKALCTNEVIGVKAVDGSARTLKP